jgi:hypothetical protein
MRNALTMRRAFSRGESQPTQERNTAASAAGIAHTANVRNARNVRCDDRDRAG